MLSNMPIFCQKPKLGDVIWTLPTVKAAGKSGYFFNPTVHGEHHRCPYWEKSFEQLIPILEQQEYIAQASIKPFPNRRYYDFYFGLYKLRTGYGKSLVKANYEAIMNWGVDQHRGLKEFKHIRQQISDNFNYDPWLKCTPIRNRELFPIVFCVSRKFNPKHWEFMNRFPKHQVANISFFKGISEQGLGSSSGKLPGKGPLVDIGTPIVMEDLLDVFEYVAGAEIFVGDSSFPQALACGLGKYQLVFDTFKRLDFFVGNEKEYLLSEDHDVNYQLASQKLSPTL